jgi:folate-dependent phosphoribosylglycinamide formyltransferase PurN
MKNIAILTGAMNPMSGYYVSALAKRGCIPRCVMVDRKTWSAKDLAIHAQRTAGRLPPSNAEAADAPCDVVMVDSHNSEETIHELKSRQCEVIINGGTPRILSRAFLSSFSAVLNCHPGILPKYRGCSCVEWAVFNDDPIGNTVHLMSEGIDEGAILRCEPVELSKADDYTCARLRIFERGFDLLAESAMQVAAGAVDLRRLAPQAEGSYWKPIDDDRMGQVIRKLKMGEYRHQS